MQTIGSKERERTQVIRTHRGRIHNDGSSILIDAALCEAFNDPRPEWAHWGPLAAGAPRVAMNVNNRQPKPT
jgi:hypothetical protein